MASTLSFWTPNAPRWIMWPNKFHLNLEEISMNAKMKLKVMIFKSSKHLLLMMHAFLCHQVEDNNAINITFGKSKSYQHSIHHPLISSFQEKTTTISKKRWFYRWALHFFFNFLLFGNVSWIINMRPYGCWKTINYILYVHGFYAILLI
jgi:hypothetical protein